jgi:ferredoxin-nitrite reductase
VEKYHKSKLLRFPLDQCDARPQPQKRGHVGVQPQKQAGRFFVGVVLPVGRITCDQMRAIADIADRHGSGTIRLTVWQNLLISDIPQEKIEAVKSELAAIGLGVEATNLRSGLVACTGNAGCKYAASNTKAHAMQIVRYLESRLELDQPVNIHLTGCHNSCAQHFIGDIGLIGAKVPVGEEEVEGYNIFVGGGYGAEQGIGRELYREVAATDCGTRIERMLRGYLDHRTAVTQSFLEFVRGHSTEELKMIFEQEAVAA